MSNMEELRKSRIQNFKNVVTGQGKVDHIPHFGNYWSWKFYDAGYALSEALYDYNKTVDTMEKFIQRYPMDILYETGYRNPVKVFEPLGRYNDYMFDDKNYSISIHDQCVIDDEDYDKIIADPKRFIWETFLPKKYSVFGKDGNSVDFHAFIGRLMEFGGAQGKITQILHQYGVVDFVDDGDPTGRWGFGFELLFNNMRGMKKLARDMRRMPDKVMAACEALDSITLNPQFEAYYQKPKGSNPQTCVDMNPVMLGHILLNPKQFEKFYWPYLEKIGKAATELDKLVFVFAEGSIAPYYDFFQQLPKDHFVILSELDDIYDIKKNLPNMVPCGGPGTDLLFSGTPEENVAYTKKLVEEIGGEDHRFVFSPSKMISFPNDCKRENLSAICQYLDSVRF